jgi:DNA-binding transcriptional LysR family regulator
MSRSGEQRRVNAGGRLRINNSFAVNDAACKGLGVAWLPLVIAAPSLAAQALVPVLPDWQLPSVPVHALFPSARYLTPKVRAFIDYAVQNFDADLV